MDACVGGSLRSCRQQRSCDGCSRERLAAHGSRLCSAVEHLVRVGLDHIEGFARKEMPAWVDAGLDFTRTVQVSTKEIAERTPDTQVLDVRSDKEGSSGHIQDAHYISLGQLKKRMEELERDIDLVAVCGSGYRSSIAASLLQANGFTWISSMDLGVTVWNQRRLPLTTS